MNLNKNANDPQDDDHTNINAEAEAKAFGDFLAAILGGQGMGLRPRNLSTDGGETYHAEDAPVSFRVMGIPTGPTNSHMSRLMNDRITDDQIDDLFDDDDDFDDGSGVSIYIENLTINVSL